jgi:hypothetical protein
MTVDLLERSPIVAVIYGNLNRPTRMAYAQRASTTLSVQSPTCPEQFSELGRVL